MALREAPRDTNRTDVTVPVVIKALLASSTLAIAVTWYEGSLSPGKNSSLECTPGNPSGNALIEAKRISTGSPDSFYLSDLVRSRLSPALKVNQLAQEGQIHHIGNYALLAYTQKEMTEKEIADALVLMYQKAAERQDMFAQDKTTKNPEMFKTQAKCYRDNLENLRRRYNR